jgi:hypothetical protein
MYLRRTSLLLALTLLFSNGILWRAEASARNHQPAYRVHHAVHHTLHRYGYLRGRGHHPLYRTVHRHQRTVHPYPNQLGHQNLHRDAHHSRAPRRAQFGIRGVHGRLAAKAQEIASQCGSRVVSGFRPGARVAGSGHPSLHASGRAVDISGNPRCIYSHLRGWPGGYSIDYGAVRHVHVSLGGREDGVRFRHHSAIHARHRHPPTRRFAKSSDEAVRVDMRVARPNDALRAGSDAGEATRINELSRG